MMIRNTVQSRLNIKISQKCDTLFSQNSWQILRSYIGWLWLHFISFHAINVTTLSCTLLWVTTSRTSVTGYKGLNCTEDIDECTRDLFLCGAGSCINIRGSFKCQCPEGKCGRQCADDDPCNVSISRPCPPSQPRGELNNWAVPTVETVYWFWVRRTMSKISSCGICGEQGGTGQVFLWEFWFLPPFITRSLLKWSGANTWCLLEAIVPRDSSSWYPQRKRKTSSIIIKLTSSFYCNLKVHFINSKTGYLTWRLDNWIWLITWNLVMSDPFWYCFWVFQTLLASAFQDSFRLKSPRPHD
jgi:hypothetical protein